MKLIIDIPKKTFEEIQERNIITCGESFAQKIVKYIKNGTPLPEHHGRLIDADAVDTRYSDPEVVETLNDAPTIIEAEGSDSK